MMCMTCRKLGCPLPISCQNDFSILNQTYEEDTYEAAYRFGVVGLPYGPLAGGTLTGKYFEKTKPEYAAKVGRCRLTLSKSVLKAPMVSALERKISQTAFNCCFQIQLAPLNQGRGRAPSLGLPAPRRARLPATAGGMLLG